MAKDFSLHTSAFVIALLASQIVGMIYYSPMLFQNSWNVARGVDPVDYANRHAANPSLFIKPALLGTAASALALYVAAHFYTFVKGGSTREGALQTFFWGWTGFYLMPTFVGLVWAEKNATLFLIEAGSSLLTGLVAAYTYVAVATAPEPTPVATRSPRVARKSHAVEDDSEEVVSSPRRARGRSRTPKKKN